MTFFRVGMDMLEVKFKFRLNFFNLGYFFQPRYNLWLFLGLGFGLEPINYFFKK